MVEEKKAADHGRTLATWMFPEFKKYKFTTGWYITTAIIVAALIIWTIFDQNYLFLLIIIIFIGILFIRNRREPNMLNIKITEDGIDINTKTFYEWKDIKKFWIIYEPPEIKNLYLEFKMGLRPSVTISMENQNPLEIRKILLEYLTEDTDKENESVSDGVSRLMKL